MTETDQMIPANDGYSLLRFTFIDRKVTPDHVREVMQALPIVAWRIVDGAVLPVAIGQRPTDDRVEAVHCPGGMIHDANGKSWNSIHAWSLDVAAAWKEWRESRGTKETPSVSTNVGAFLGRGIGLITTNDAVKQ